MCSKIVLFLACTAMAGDAAAQPRNGAVPFDSAVYADRATAELIDLARIKHGTRSTQLSGYRAKTFTQIEGRVGGSRFTGGVSLFHYETVAQVHWQQPGDTRVDVIGARSAAVRLPAVDRDQMAGFWAEVLADEPWFIPESMGDEIQLMGIPDEEALHPLASDGDRFYQYTMTDSMRIGLPGRDVRAIAVRVTPLEYNPTVLREPRPPAPVARPERAPDSAFTREAEQQIAEVQTELRASMEGSDRRLELLDSLGRLETQRRRRVRVREHRGRSRPPTLVSGEMWLDGDSLDVVRLIVTFVGENIWDDDEDAPELITLEADLEYGLHLNRFWLPHSQLLAATFEYKYLPGAKVPTTAVTTFSDYEVALDSTMTVAEGLRGPVTGRRFGSRWRCEPWGWTSSKKNERCGEGAFRKSGVREDGTRWEVSLPPMDSLLQYEFDSDFHHAVDLASEPFVRERLAHMARLSEQLPDQVSGRQAGGIDWLSAAQAFNFNRVQGPSLGLGYQWRPGIDFTTIHLDGRVGLSDRRITGGVSWRLDDPTGRADFGAFHQMKDVEPWTGGLTLGNSLRALVLGHDNADYYLGTGGSATLTGNHGWQDRLELTLRFERQESVRSQLGTGDPLSGSGRYPSNPPVIGGKYFGVRASKVLGVGPLEFELGVEGLASNALQGGRGWGIVTVPFRADRLQGSVRTRGGFVSGRELPQLMFRAGGPWTVRAFDYGTRRGTSLWAAQLDLEWVVNQWWSPVVFGDVGDVDRFRDPLVGAGVGVSLLSGWVRLDLAKAINPWGNFRFDAAFQIPVN